jgi:multidrug efflux system membrane fusion protein
MSAPHLKLLSLALVLAAPALTAAPTASAPASISKEGDLVIVRLTADAEKRLRLKTAPLEKKAVPVTRLYAGEVVVPLGAKAGAVAPVVNGDLNALLLLADQQAAADGRVRQAQVRVDAARIALERAQVVLKAEAGSVRAVDEAKAALGLAEAELATAKDQRALLGKALDPTAAGRRVWVRAAIYSGEVAALDATAAVSVAPIGTHGKASSAQPVAGPPTANALANTIDWYYELPAASPLRAGLRVAVEIPLTDAKAERLVVPFSAVLHDIHGGQWVYERTADHAYARRRVTVERLAGSAAVLAHGPPVGAEIVTDGAAELFGTEFVTGK